VYSYDFESVYSYDCLIVFLHLFSTLREVVLIPNRHWGGEGLLGCIFGCVIFSVTTFAPIEPPL